MSLRPYQSEAVAALDTAYEKGTYRPGINIFTGGGKTRIMSYLNSQWAPNVRAARGERPTGHVMTLLHRDTLCEQTLENYKPDLVRGTSIGMVKANKNQTGAHSIVASIHTLRSPMRRAALPPIDLCIIDEAHVSVSPTYMDVFDHIGVFDGRCKLAGFTATWSRASGDLSKVWQEIVFSRSTQWGIDNGYLVKPRALQVGRGVDMSAARISAVTGDYIAGDLDVAVMSDELASVVVNGAKEHGRDMPSVLFAPTKLSVNFFLDALQKAGFNCATIFDDTSPEQRREIHRQHRLGKLDIIGTCLALAEGWDAPYCSRLLLIRPITHEGLFVQIVGRILRLWPGKSDALILDFVKATDNVRLRNSICLDSHRESESTISPDDAVLGNAGIVLPEPKTVKVRHDTVEVSLFPDSAVVWRSAHGIPYVAMGSEVVALVDTANGTNVGWFKGYSPDGRLDGRWLAEGVDQSIALEIANDAAEGSSRKIMADRTAPWRRQSPSPRMRTTAIARGINPDGLLRGQLSDALEDITVHQQIERLAQWQRAMI